MPQLARNIRPMGRLIIFGKNPFYSKFLIDAIDTKYFKFSHEIIWDKKNGSNPLSQNTQPATRHENIMVLNRTLNRYIDDTNPVDKTRKVTYNPYTATYKTKHIKNIKSN